MNYDSLNSLVSQGLSSYKIAKQLNCSQTTVTYWLKKLNLKTKCIKFQKKDKTESRTEKLCCKCKVILSIDKFYEKGNRGLSYSYCKDCAKEDVVARFRKYKIQSVEYKGGKCQICGYNKYFGALDFHHLDPSEKDFSPGHSNKSFETMKPELDKCILLCANCHREAHAGIINIKTTPAPSRTETMPSSRA